MIDGDYVSDLLKLRDCARIAGEKFGRVPWFRGQPSNRPDWKLKPKIFRIFHDPAEHEFSLMGRMRTEAPVRHGGSPDQDDLAGWLALMQHHGTPTRLLDWTESILVAAFFAVAYDRNSPWAPSHHPREDALIWAMSPAHLNNHWWHKHLVFGLCSPDIRKTLLEPAFTPGLEQSPSCAAVTHPHLDLRMLLQHATYTVHGCPEAMEEAEWAREMLIKFVIPWDVKDSLANDLWHLGVRRSILFPDLDSLATDMTGLELRTEEARLSRKYAALP